jgi:ubiquinone/menaquinone biosynthesis C-methylase UbiE
MRALEIEKYAEAYLHSEYRMGRKRFEAVKTLVNVPRGTWLDVGTGRGETLDLAEKAGHTVTGTEVVPYLCNDRVRYAEAHRLPFKAKQFDYVTCLDVLEHLTEADIIPALMEIKRVSKRWCFVTAANFPHLYRGVDMHISAKPIPEWGKIIRDAWGQATYVGKFGISPAWRFDYAD